MNKPVFSPFDIVGNPLWNLSKAIMNDQLLTDPAYKPTPAELESYRRHFPKYRREPRRDEFAQEGLPKSLTSKPNGKNSFQTQRIFRSEPPIVSDRQPIKELEHLYQMRKWIMNSEVSLNTRERIRQEFCWFNWLPLFKSIGEPAITLWKSVIEEELRVNKRFTFPIIDPELLQYLNEDQLDQLSRSYLTRLQKIYKHLFDLTQGQLVSILSDFEHASIKVGIKVLPAIMESLDNSHPRLVAVRQYFGLRTKYEQMIAFIKERVL